MANRALCFLLLAAISGGATAQDKAATKPDHTRVSPNRHEGVIREPHIQYTHVENAANAGLRWISIDRPRPKEYALPS